MSFDFFLYKPKNSLKKIKIKRLKKCIYIFVYYFIARI